MKKTTKQATNLSFPVSKGALLPFDTLNLKFIAFFVFFFALLTIPTTKILASTIFTDNFDSYNLANLVGQGSWLCAGDDYDNFDVVSGTAQSGSQFIQQSTPIVAWCNKTGSALATGTISIWTKFPNCGQGSIRDYAEFIVRDTSSSGAMAVQFGANEFGQCQIVASGGSTTDSYNKPLNYFDNWTEMRFDWQFAGGVGQIKYYIGNEIALNEWSNAIPSFNSFDKVEIISTLHGDNQPANFDAIGESLEATFSP